MPALQNLITGLTQLSKSDSALNQKIYAIHHFISSPEDVNGEELLKTLDDTKSLAVGYELKGENKLLPVVFQSAMAELEHQIKSKKLMQMDDKVAQLRKNIQNFHQLAIRG